MSELETLLEQKLIDQLVYGDSQWTYRSDLKTEEDLWKRCSDGNSNEPDLEEYFLKAIGGR